MRTSLLLFLGTALLCACSAVSTKKHKDPIDPGDEFELGDPPPEEQPMSTDIDEDAGAAFNAPSRPQTKDAGHDPDPDPADAGPKTFCAGPLEPADLAIVELMVTTRAGSLDDGEWVEIRSTRDCWLELQGVSIESPRGAAVDSVTIDHAVELAPHGTFVVADSADPAKNHAIPGLVFAWNASDVLKNSGDTITVKLGASVIDTVTYPSFANLEAGRSLAFPSDCAPGVRSDWTRWSLAFGAWAGDPVKGTPNATNSDVACY